MRLSDMSMPLAFSITARDRIASAILRASRAVALYLLMLTIAAASCSANGTAARIRSSLSCKCGLGLRLEYREVFAGRLGAVPQWVQKWRGTTMHAAYVPPA